MTQGELVTYFVCRLFRCTNNEKRITFVIDVNHGLKKELDVHIFITGRVYIRNVLTAPSSPGLLSGSGLIDILSPYECDAIYEPRRQ